MKSALKKIGIWIVLSILMSIYWIIGLMIGNAVFPSKLLEASGSSNENGGLFILITCALNTAAVLYYIARSDLRGRKLVGTLFLIIFGIQFFMSQIETVWFNDALHMEVNLILNVVFGGAIMAVLFAFSATWITGRFSKTETLNPGFSKLTFSPVWKEIILLAAVLWPAVYFLAGYLIAWQFEAVRLFYSGSTSTDSFLTMMKENIATGLYFFQIFRGFLWILIAFLVILTTKGSWVRKGLALGLLLSVLGSSQLLLPNPIMPDAVRMGHLIETGISSFIWGFILAWFLRKITPPAREDSSPVNLSNQPSSQMI